MVGERRDQTRIDLVFPLGCILVQAIAQQRVHLATIDQVITFRRCRQPEGLALPGIGRQIDQSARVGKQG